MSTQLLPPNYQPPGGADNNTRRLGPLQQFTRRRYMLFHLGFTLRLINRCLGDSRVAAGSKALFFGVTALVLFMVLVPEAGADIMALLVPIAGPAFDLLGIPAEGAIDWGFLVLVIGALMRLFPAEVLQQHIAELQGWQWVAPPASSLPYSGAALAPGGAPPNDNQVPPPNGGRW